MAKRKGPSSFHKFLIIAGSLVAIEVLYLYVFRSAEEPVTAREAIAKAVEKQDDLPVQRKSLMKVQLALADFRSKKGSYPKTLDDLVPEYFDFAPNDPTSNRPYKYQIIDGRYILGDELPKSKGGSGLDAEQKIDPAVLATLESDTEKASFVYDPTGKRDPFAAFDFSPKTVNPMGKTPLEQYTVGQLRYTSFLQGFDESIAIVENSAGRGYTVKKGTKIGPNGGEVVDIQPDKIVIVETNTDFTGNTKTDTLELKLRTKEQEKKR